MVKTALPASDPKAFQAPFELSARESMDAASDRFLIRFLDLGGLSILGFFFLQNVLTSSLLAGSNLVIFLLLVFLPSRLAVATGRKQLARWWFVCSLNAAVMVLPWFVTGLRTPMLTAASLALLLVSWLLGRWWMMLFGVLHALSFLGYWTAEKTGWYVPPIEPRSIDFWFLTYLEVLFLTAIALWALMRNHEAVHLIEIKLRGLLAKEVARSAVALEQLAEIYDGLSAHVCVLDEHGVIQSVNKAWRDFFEVNGGVPGWQHVGKSYLDVCTAAIRSASADLHEAASFYVLLQDVMAGKREHFEMEYECSSPTEKRWYFVRVSRIAGSDPVHIVVAHDDVTTVKQAQEQLRASLAFTRKLIESMQEGFSVLDGTGRAFDANPALCRMTGFTRDELVGIKAPFPYWPPEELDNIRAAFEKTLQGQAGEFELTFMRKNGERFPVSVTASSVMDEHGKLVNYVATVNDITERRRVQEQVQRLAFYDPLTSLPNRRLLNDRMNLTLASCKRTGKFAALLVLDLDNFKTLNDDHGHATGDLLLIEAAQRIRSCVREVDTVARLGGDEFVVLMQELSADPVTSKEQIGGVAEKIRFVVSQPFRLAGPHGDWVEHHCTASIGAAMFNDIVPDVAEILQFADQAMYQAKSEGRNRVCFYDADAHVRPA